MKRQLFDPLRFLENQLLLNVYQGQDGGIYLQGIGSLPPRKRKQAKWVLDRYHGLLLLQWTPRKRSLDHRSRSCLPRAEYVYRMAVI
jgi:hypothetical protein